MFVENNLLNPFALMTTEAFSRNVGKLFSELKLVIDNLPLDFLIFEKRDQTKPKLIYPLVCAIKFESSVQKRRCGHDIIMHHQTSLLYGL